MLLGISVYSSLDATVYYVLNTSALSVTSLEQGPYFGNVGVPPQGPAQEWQHYLHEGDVIETATNKQAAFPLL